MALVRRASLIIAVVAAACSPGGADRTPKSCSSPEPLSAHVASYDLAVGPPSRFIVGLLAADNCFVSFGRVTLRLAYLGTKESPQEEVFGKPISADFLLLPSGPGETPPPILEGPVSGPASRGRGVYRAEVQFDRAGFWKVEATAKLAGQGTLSADSSFEVLAEHAVPAPGDDALPTENLTLSSGGAPRDAIDSRAVTDEGIPDSELHQTTIAQAIRDRRPAIVVFSTPVYCVSRFCGPVTDMVSSLARDYESRAAFIHIEIWRNFEEQAINKAAAEWLLRNGDLTEPWVFLIGADGRIAARWDNVATREEIEPLLQALPAG